MNTRLRNHRPIRGWDDIAVVTWVVVIPCDVLHSLVLFSQAFDWYVKLLADFWKMHDRLYYSDSHTARKLHQSFTLLVNVKTPTLISSCWSGYSLTNLWPTLTVYYSSRSKEQNSIHFKRGVRNWYTEHRDMPLIKQVMVTTIVINGSYYVT